MRQETERAKFNNWLGIKHCGAAHDLAWEAWKARAALEAKQGAAWIHVIDEAMVCAHIGVADAFDDYATAKEKLNKLICWEIDVAKHFEQESRQAEVKMPEPAAVVHAKLGTTCMIPGASIRKGDKLYTDQQLRTLLAQHGIKIAD